jgi:hypothetical protein
MEHQLAHAFGQAPTGFQPGYFGLQDEDDEME